LVATVAHANQLRDTVFAYTDVEGSKDKPWRMQCSIPSAAGQLSILGSPYHLIRQDKINDACDGVRDSSGAIRQ
jgi:hypothetical protein